MTERLLQFIWQFQYFNKGDLQTVAGDTLQVIAPGLLNINQGPDFQNAKIRIEKTTWAGSVELHLKTSDWNRHHHEKDRNYNNVILHVVWEHDRAEHTVAVPVLELKGRVPGLLIKRYEELMHSTSFIPCEKSIHTVRDIIWTSWQERLLAERLIRKAEKVEQYLRETNYHWEEVFWWMLARNFGMRVNTEAFEQIARSIPLPVLARHKNQVIQLEAILLGQAGLLEKNFTEEYPNMLKKEYRFLKEKYALKPIHEPVQFLRMRPGNFPTLRLAQLAMLVHGSAHLFSRIREARQVADIRQWFDVTAHDYWHCHYRLDEPATYRKKKLGQMMIDNIIINTVAPVLFAYGNYHNQPRHKDKALKCLEEAAPEMNVITKGFMNLGIPNTHAYHSQALIELKNKYCNRKRCLDCAAGNAILKS